MWATKDFPTPTGPNREVDATWSVRSNTSFTNSSRDDPFVGAWGRVGAGEISNVRLPVLDLGEIIVEGLFFTLGGSPCNVGEVLATSSVLL